MTQIKNLILSLFLLAPVGLFGQTTENQEFLAKDFSILGIENTVGDITIKSGSGDKILIKTTKKKFGEHCLLELEASGADIEIELENKDESKGRCDVDFLVELPKDALQKIDMSLGSGDLKITDVHPQIEFSSGSGDTRIQTNSVDLEGEAGSGDIIITGSPVSIDLKLGSGEASIEGSPVSTEMKLGSGGAVVKYESVPKDADLDIKTGSGSVSVYLPAKTSFRTSFISPAGKLESKLTEDKDSKFKISMMSGSGGLKILKKK